MKDGFQFGLAAAVLFVVPALVIYGIFAFFSFDLQWYLASDLRVVAFIIWAIIILFIGVSAAN